MGDRLHVLVHGTLDAGVCDFLRVGTFVEPLAALGVEVRAWSSFADDALNGGQPSPGGDAAAGGARRDEAGALLSSLGLTALAWADVVVFRRWHATVLACSSCGAPVASLDALAGHLATTGHLSLTPDLTLEPLVALLEAHPELLDGRGVLYETDDDVLDVPDWTGLGRSARAEANLIRRTIALADLVTVSTPVLAERLTPHARGEVRVVRNAVDPAWYWSDPHPVEDDGTLPIVYHGAPVRLRDYAVAQPAIDALAAARPAVRRVWLGAGHDRTVAGLVDEALPWVEGAAAFGGALAAARPGIGVAPLLDEPFNRAKSELHWIEYALAGAPCVVTGFAGPGPFDIVRDGLDALVATTPEDWHRHLAALADSPELRARIAGAARERVLRESTLDAKAPEWAQAYREAASLGRGRRCPTA